MILKIDSLSSARRRLMPVLFVLLATFASTGCAAVGALAHKLMGPPATPAKYILTKQRTLVLVESYKHPVSSFAISELLARAVIEDLQDAEPKLELVPPDALTQLRDADADRFSKMRVSEVAAALQAKQVIYVDVQQSMVEPVAGGEYLRGTMLVRVKVIDENGKLLWPENSEGFPVGTETPTVQIGKGINASSLQDNMAESVGLSIGRLFHKWKVE